MVSTARNLKILKNHCSRGIIVKGFELNIFVDLAHFDEKKLAFPCPIPSELWSTRPDNFELWAMATNKRNKRLM